MHSISRARRLQRYRRVPSLRVLRLAVACSVFFAAVSHVIELASVFPHHLAFFNCGSGGVDAGHKYLLNSNLDWGQDLVLLKEWISSNRLSGRPYLFYYGCCNPRDVGIDFELPQRECRTGGALTLPQGKRQLIVSTNILCGMLSRPVPDRNGAWVRLDERFVSELLQSVDGWERIGATLWVSTLSRSGE